MFMFWSKRTVLTRRLLKAKVRGEHETECEAQEDSSHIHRTNNTSGAAGYDTSINNNNHSHNNNNNNNVTTTIAATGQVSRGGGGGGGGGGAAAALSNTGAAGGTVAISSRTTSRLHQGCCGGDSSQDEDEDPSRLLRCKELLKSLKENQLEMLLTAIESYGADLGSCVLVPRQQRSETDGLYVQQQQEQQQQQQQQQQTYHGGRTHRHHYHHLRYQHYRYPRSRHHRSSSIEDEEERCCSTDDSASPLRKTERCKRNGGNSASGGIVVPMRRSSMGECESNVPNDPHLLCCQIWRWPDLEYSSELKRLPICHSAKDPVYICCNPYHWSRLCKPESPPPPYCLIADRLRPEDHAPNEGDQLWCKNSTPLPLPGSLTTNGEGEMGQREWCTLAYWELADRVGRLYPVEPSTVNVFDSLHDGDGLCLATLSEHHNAPPAVQRTRSKIGLGLTLSQEADGVWAYNRSESPIFVNSPTLDDPDSRTVIVYRVPPGFCLNIFDRAKILQLPYNASGGQTAGFASGPVDINSVRISFAKGWGPKYSRQEVTSCPCWLEILLAPCR